MCKVYQVALYVGSTLKDVVSIKNDDFNYIKSGASTHAAKTPFCTHLEIYLDGQLVASRTGYRKWTNHG